MPEKIALMIIGAQKAGTSSLNTYLAQHPNIRTHFTQEFGLFADVASFNKGFEYYIENTVKTDVKNDPDKNIFIAKRAGLLYKPDMLYKLKEHNPAVKIVIVLRNPVNRAFSAFWYCRRMGMEPFEKFEDAIYEKDLSRFKGNHKLENNCNYISGSSYADYVKNVYSIFEPRNISIALFEDIRLDLNKYLNELLALLGLESHFSFDTDIKYNERSASRSSFLANQAAPGRNEILKKFLPFKLRTFLKQTVKKVNTKKLENDIKTTVMEENVRRYLTNAFQKDVMDLQQFTGLPLNKFWPEFFI